MVNLEQKQRNWVSATTQMRLQSLRNGVFPGSGRAMTSMRNVMTFPSWMDFFKRALKPRKLATDWCSRWVRLQWGGVSMTLEVWKPVNLGSTSSYRNILPIEIRNPCFFWKAHVDLSAVCLTCVSSVSRSADSGLCISIQSHSQFPQKSLIFGQILLSRSYSRCQNYRTEVEEYEGTVIYLTLLFYNSVFLGRYEKNNVSEFTPNFFRRSIILVRPLSFYNAINIMEVPEIIQRWNLIIERGHLIIERIRIRAESGSGGVRRYGI